MWPFCTVRCHNTFNDASAWLLFALTYRLKNPHFRSTEYYLLKYALYLSYFVVGLFGSSIIFLWWGQRSEERERAKKNTPLCRIAMIGQCSIVFILLIYDVIECFDRKSNAYISEKKPLIKKNNFNQKKKVENWIFFLFILWFLTDAFSLTLFSFINNCSEHPLKCYTLLW